MGFQAHDNTCCCCNPIDPENNYKTVLPILIEILNFNIRYVFIYLFIY